MYIGWDIGIKNLSYCLLDDVTDNNNTEDTNNQENIISLSGKKIKIVDWGVINIVDDVSIGTPSFEKRTPINCGFGNCKKKGLYCHKEKTNNNYFGLCTIHYKKVGDNHKNDFIFLEKKPKCCKEECKKLATYYTTAHEYITYCGVHYNQLKKKEPTVEYVKVDKKVKATSINLTKLATSLYKLLDKVPIILKVNCVLLENQPVLKNPTMKSVQMLLYGYYVIRGISDYRKGKLEKPIETIKCYSANQKNKLVSLLDEDQQTYITDVLKQVKSKYTKNKKGSIMITERILSHKMEPSTKWKDVFNSSKKKDDLADSLLMTLHYLLK